MCLFEISYVDAGWFKFNFRQVADVCIGSLFPFFAGIDAENSVERAKTKQTAKGESECDEQHNDSGGVLQRAAVEYHDENNGYDYSDELVGGSHVVFHAVK